jgi:hypothetical protein
MAECVSCGKEIPAGKFFCDECYVKMKGRRGGLKEVPHGSAGKPGVEEKAADVCSEAEAASEPVIAAGLIAAKKASGTLTPTSGKKVVSIKPGAEKPVKEKAGKKKFKITITFSERTYAALSRLRGRKEKKGQVVGGEAGAAAVAPVRSRAPARSKGPHGRAKLKAVKGLSRPAGEQGGGFMGVVTYRDRTWDHGDIAAVAMASFAVLMIIVLSFLPWAEFSWTAGEPLEMQVVEVKGIDLGAMTYICIALAVIAFLYMVATWLLKGPFTKIDYGVVLIVAGVVFIPLFYATIASNTRFLIAALEKVGKDGSSVPSQYERQTLWPAYAMVLMGATLAFSGLVRLAERKGSKSPGGK